MLDASPSEVRSQAKCCAALNLLKKRTYLIFSTLFSCFIKQIFSFEFVQSVLVSVFYSKPQRLDVYVDNNLVAPNNAVWNGDKTDYILSEPIIASK